MSRAHDIGRMGEERAQKYLIKNSYEILDTNYHSRWGEIDIVAKKCGTLAFVEVKTRAKGSMVKPVEAVNKTKVKRLIRTAYAYIYDKNVQLQPRFDICEVEYSPVDNSVKVINYIKNAFILEDEYEIF